MILLLYMRQGWPTGRAFSIFPDPFYKENFCLWYNTGQYGHVAQLVRAHGSHP